MPKRATAFAFTDYTWNESERVLSLVYTVTFADGEERQFTETLAFSAENSLMKLPETLQASLLQNIHLMLGISYWKLFCPPKILLEKYHLTPQQAEFWNTVYTKGLGEFFYKNKIDFRGLVQFPSTDGEAPAPTALTVEDTSLVPIGGGKDSIVTAEYLKETGKPFEMFLLNEHPLQTRVVEVVGVKSVVVHRTLDAGALELARSGAAYNGHIPVTAIYSMIGLLVAAMRGHKYLVLSNEKSASYGNVEYLGEEINHQWSKSEEFERMFAEYVKRYITPSITPFSLLRPYYEIEVVRRFTRYPQYFSLFSSCNRNFAIRNALAGKLWCGECPKCAFVFALLSAFLPKAELVQIFGKNLYKDAALVPLYRELLGLEAAKPFECVGTPEETIVAMHRAMKTEAYTGEVVMKMLQHEIHADAQEVSRMEEQVFARHDDMHIPEMFK